MMIICKVEYRFDWPRTTATPHRRYADLRKFRKRNIDIQHGELVISRRIQISTHLIMREATKKAHKMTCGAEVAPTVSSWGLVEHPCA